MNDLISRQAAIEAVGDIHPLDYNGQAILHRIQQLPSAEKHGKWEYTEVRQYPVGYNLAKCSCCGWTHHSRPGEKYILTAEDAATYFKYCPHCGAKNGSE